MSNFSMVKEFYREYYVICIAWENKALKLAKKSLSISLSLMT